MAEGAVRAERAAPLLGAVGLFVEIEEGLWVNARHVAAVVPIEGIKRGEPVQQCRVYVAGPSLGGGHVLAWNSRTTSVAMVAALSLAFKASAKEQGYQEECGRIDALEDAEAGSDDDD